MVFSSVQLNRKKKIQRNTLKYFFGVFGFSEESKLIEGKQKREKLFTWESSQQAKEEQGNLFGFSFKYYN